MAELPAPLQWLSTVGVTRLAAAARTLPTSCSHPAACAAVVLGIAVAVLLGLATGALQLRPEQRPDVIAEVLFAVFLGRGLTQELAARGLALPHPAVDGPTPPDAFAARSIIVSMAFSAWHLLLPGEPAQRAAARRPAALVGTTALSLLCCGVYYTTGGSLAAAVVTYGAVAAAWLLLLGGAEQLYPLDEPSRGPAGPSTRAAGAAAAAGGRGAGEAAGAGPDRAKPSPKKKK